MDLYYIRVDLCVVCVYIHPMEEQVLYYMRVDLCVVCVYIINTSHGHIILHESGPVCGVCIYNKYIPWTALSDRAGACSGEGYTSPLRAYHTQNVNNERISFTKKNSKQ